MNDISEIHHNSHPFDLIGLKASKGKALSLALCCGEAAGQLHAHDMEACIDALRDIFEERIATNASSDAMGRTSPA